MSAFDETRSEQKEISRRGFFKGTAALVGAGIVADSTLSAAQAQAPGAGAAAQASHVAGYSGQGDWLGTAPAILDSEITKVVEVDVLVLGGGHGGLLAALGASDKGAKVAVIEAKDEAGFLTQYFYRVGEDIGHVNSKWLLKRGYGPYDTGEIVAEFVKRGAGRSNPEIVRLFVENSGAMFDRMVEVYESYGAKRKADDSAVKYSDGVTETFDFSNLMDEKYLFNQVQKDRSPKDYPTVLGGYKTWPTVAMFQGPVRRKFFEVMSGPGPASVLRWFEKYTVLKTVDNGAQWFYEHTAVVLTQDAGGAVTGAIVQEKKSKNYLKFVARKGVVVTTGDFSGNTEMCWALLNERMEQMERSGVEKSSLKSMASTSNGGSGHKMCCWAGGMIEPSPRGTMNRGSLLIGTGVTGPWGMGPMLELNSEAKRFANESAAPLLGPACARQLMGILCAVTDKKYLKSIVIAGLEHGGPNFGRAEWLPDMEEDMAKVVAAGAKGLTVRGITVAERMGGVVYGANTLEELAGYLGYKGDLAKTFVESVNRYNDHCRKGVDSDFGKDPKALIAVDEPPFYGCKGETGQITDFGMVTLAGMVTDTRLRVLDKSGKPIKGLYVAGNTLGGRYGLSYTTPMAGNSIGMAMTHGWLAGKSAAEA